MPWVGRIVFRDIYAPKSLSVLLVTPPQCRFGNNRSEANMPRSAESGSI